MSKRRIIKLCECVIVFHSYVILQERRYAHVCTIPLDGWVSINHKFPRGWGLTNPALIWDDRDVDHQLKNWTWVTGDRGCKASKSFHVIGSDCVPYNNPWNIANNGASGMCHLKRRSPSKSSDRGGVIDWEPSSWGAHGLRFDRMHIQWHTRIHVYTTIYNNK